MPMRTDVSSRARLAMAQRRRGRATLRPSGASRLADPCQCLTTAEARRTYSESTQHVSDRMMLTPLTDARISCRSLRALPALLAGSRAARAAPAARTVRAETDP